MLKQSLMTEEWYSGISWELLEGAFPIHLRVILLGGESPGSGNYCREPWNLSSGHSHSFIKACHQKASLLRSLLKQDSFASLPSGGQWAPWLFQVFDCLLCAHASIDVCACTHKHIHTLSDNTEGGKVIKTFSTIISSSFGDSTLVILRVLTAKYWIFLCKVYTWLSSLPLDQPDLWWLPTIYPWPSKQM